MTRELRDLSSPRQERTPVNPDELSLDEQKRMKRVVALLPKNALSILEIGARHGAMTQCLAAAFPSVTALDLEIPSFEIFGVSKVKGDVQRLQFADNSFDCVVCTEVLEHVADVAAAAREITRVARSHVIIGVPYRQDRRVGRLTCTNCGKINPPYGHLNAFDEQSVVRLFDGARKQAIEYIAENRERTNALSTWLQDIADNPYGDYNQEESCVYCHRPLEPMTHTSFLRRVAASVGLRLYKAQQAWNRPLPTWMLVLFEKKPAPVAV